MDLARIRRERNMSRYRLSKAAGISQPYVGAIESGAKSPTLRILEKLAKALNVTVGELIGDERPRQEEPGGSRLRGVCREWPPGGDEAGEQREQSRDAQ